MRDLIAETVEAKAWVEKAKSVYTKNSTFGKVLSGVIWHEIKDSQGKKIIDVNPHIIVDEINTIGQNLLNGHDPGLIVGQALAAGVFVDVDGVRFVAALFGLYGGGTRLYFNDITIQSVATPMLCLHLPVLTNDYWIEIGTDSREIDSNWLGDALSQAPLRIERTRYSHNAADPLHQLIRLGIAFSVLLWNPFITAIANEAGKDACAAMHHWMRRFFSKLSELRSPILEVQSHIDGCRVSFMVRGTSVKRHYAAHDALPAAAARAAALVSNMKAVGLEAKQIVYEFHKDDDLWFPSFAVLFDGRLVTDNNTLIATENLPSGLSLGLSLDTASDVSEGKRENAPERQQDTEDVAANREVIREGQAAIMRGDFTVVATPADREALLSRLNGRDIVP